ncbi:hypothetical protein NQ315_004205 [Exocentrus adspersus]|uniref:Uncharacterized protein n=1 Tax=Exocentrus adspersus TaxID=1586481 RepID=A0AAV8W822_9CUCU|nr:hypothetical protein NQ315_004205 [Exocentrus adspersus]
MSKVNNYSENEDDPEVYESSGDEWNSETEKKTNNRRSSQRLSKKPRVAVVEDESTSEEALSSDESSDEDRKRRKPKNGMNKKQKGSNNETTTNSTSNSSNANNTNSNTTSPSSDSGKPAQAQPISRGIHRKFIPKTIFSEDYATGSFVIQKKDAQVGDPAKHPCIWRIDGKALLQKYEAFDEDGKVRHKNTSIYTGWSPMDKDLYAPVTVDVVQHNNQNLTVELHWDKLKEINMDSD